MFDVFYFGPKPDRFAHEQPADSLEDASLKSKTRFYWYIYGGNDYTNFDFDWRPVPWESTYIHAWPSQWCEYGGTYFVNRDTVKSEQWHFHKQIITRTKLHTESNWHTIYPVDSFDYSWHPHPFDPPYIYVFGNQWYPAERMPTVEYHVPGATERKYMYEPVPRLPERHSNRWRTLIDCEWDYSWVPDPGDPPYIYVFGNQWHRAEIMPTLEYHMPGAAECKYMEYPQATLIEDKTLWTVPEEVNEHTVDFSWVPDPGDPPYIYHFGTDYQKTVGLTYSVPGATEIKLVDEIPAQDKSNSLRVLDIFYIDFINPNSSTRFERLKERYPHIQRVRYANDIMATIKRCCTRSSTNRFWVISSKNNYDQFDFNWHPETWQSYMTHVFPSQWQKWTDTFLINRWEFDKHSKWAKGIEEFPGLNFVKDQQVHAESDGSNIYYVDHGNPTNQLARLQTQYPKLKVTRFVDNYLDVFKRIMATADTEYVWIINSICNYDTFDFTWHPEAWQSEMIHVFASGLQRRGDTFYIHVESFKTQMYELEILDWFNVINYCEDQHVDRWATPIVVYEGDSIIPSIVNHNFEFPYAVFTDTHEASYIGIDPCMWHPKDRVAEAITSSGSISLVPRDIKTHLKTQIYDYPYVNRKKRHLLREESLDIIFISNGEPDEELMFHHTEYMTNSDVKWIRGVNGRTAAYQAAAQASTTPWFFAVFAKLEVVGNSFPWYDWQPDYWQEPKHYIFNARNPVNGLEYGHQGMIAYNKKLVLENNNPGIDFTLSQPHESVPLLSGTARFNQDPWMTWRTAFREVIKLIHFNETQPTVETTHRLHTWLTKADGEYAKWCLRGANDAAEYYNEVGGNYDKLLLSFDWPWLKARFDQLK